MGFFLEEVPFNLIYIADYLKEVLISNVEFVRDHFHSKVALYQLKSHAVVLKDMPGISFLWGSGHFPQVKGTSKFYQKI